MMLPVFTVLHSIGAKMTAPSRLMMNHMEMVPSVLRRMLQWVGTIPSPLIYPWFNPRGVILDTLLLSRLYHPDLFDIDKRSDKIPTKLHGSHSLEAYGHRLGEYKGEFSKTTDWKDWSQEMQDYCIQDVVVTQKLCDHFHPYLTGSR